MKSGEQLRLICVAYKIDERFQLSSHKRLNSLSYWKILKMRLNLVLSSLLFIGTLIQCNLKVGVTMLLNPEIAKV